jgi:hypothetical protein
MPRLSPMRSQIAEQRSTPYLNSGQLAPSREAVEASLLAVLRARYPRRPITVKWSKPDAVLDLEAAARMDGDLVQAR